MKREKSFRVFVIYAILFQFAILMSQKTVINDITSSTVENYNARDATVQVLISYTDTGSDESKLMAYTGSGTIIFDDNQSVYVLTARHVCTPINSVVPYGYGLTPTVEVQDIDGGFHDADITLISTTDDLCVVKYEPNYSGQRTAASISKESAVLDSTVYMYAAPAGFYVPSALTQFSGTFSGEVSMGIERSSVYTVPATGGASGAAIVNKSGEIIGVLHSTLVDFHHISLASTHARTVKFIEELEVQERIIILD
jgi:S1-C subfamily serine protease